MGQDGEDELQIYGTQVDTVERVSHTANNNDQIHEYLNEVGRMIDSLPSYPGSSHPKLEDLKWKVPIAGALHPRMTAAGHLDLRSAYYALRQELSLQLPFSGVMWNRRLKTVDQIAKRGLNYLLAL